MPRGFAQQTPIHALLLIVQFVEPRARTLMNNRRHGGPVQFRGPERGGACAPLRIRRVRQAVQHRTFEKTALQVCVWASVRALVPLKWAFRAKHCLHLKTSEDGSVPNARALPSKACATSETDPLV